MKILILKLFVEVVVPGLYDYCKFMHAVLKGTEGLFDVLTGNC